MVCTVGLAALVATVVALVAEYAVVCATGVVVVRATLVAIGRDGAAVAVDALAVLALAVTTLAAPHEVAMTTRYANAYSDGLCLKRRGLRPAASLREACDNRWVQSAGVLATKSVGRSPSSCVLYCTRVRTLCSCMDSRCTSRDPYMDCSFLL